MFLFVSTTATSNLMVHTSIATMHTSIQYKFSTMPVTPVSLFTRSENVILDHEHWFTFATPAETLIYSCRYDIKE
jgi:hypothetical protein